MSAKDKIIDDLKKNVNEIVETVSDPEFVKQYKQNTKKKVKKSRLAKNQHICVSCNKVFTEPDIEYGPDPYNSDVNNNDTPVWECGPCRHESAMDI